MSPEVTQSFRLLPGASEAAPSGTSKDRQQDPDRTWEDPGLFQVSVWSQNPDSVLMLRAQELMNLEAWRPNFYPLGLPLTGLVSCVHAWRGMYVCVVGPYSCSIVQRPLPSKRDPSHCLPSSLVLNSLLLCLLFLEKLVPISV